MECNEGHSDKKIPGEDLEECLHAKEKKNHYHGSGWTGLS